jgi:hypothetical protein
MSNVVYINGGNILTMNYVCKFFHFYAKYCSSTKTSVIYDIMLNCRFFATVGSANKMNKLSLVGMQLQYLIYYQVVCTLF